MANRAISHGLQFLTAEKHLGERNKYVESEICLWVEAILEDPIPPKPFAELLKDGVLLCRVINTLKEGSIPKIKRPFTKDGCIENIEAFLSACKSMGVPEDKLFKANDLYLGENIPQVVIGLIELGKSCYSIPNFEGPYLGPKPTGQLRQWSDEVLRASDGLIPSQYGTNRFANQSGVRFGTFRDVMFAKTNVKDQTPKPKGEAAVQG